MGSRAREGVVTTGAGRRIGYLDRGPEAGHPVLYLHGMPGSRLEQRLLPDAALDRFGVRLVSVDRPGWGDTDALPGDRVARAGDGLAVCDTLGIETFTVMSVSSGGSYSVALAATAADRVERLVLVSAQMPYDDADAIATLRADQLALVPFLRDGRSELVVAGAEQYRQQLLADPMSAFAGAAATLSAGEREFLDRQWVRDLVAADITAGVRACVDGIVDDLLLWPVPFEIDPADVRCPVLAVHGTDDDWEPLPNLRRVLRRFGRAELVLLDGQNHLGPLRYPDLVLGLVTCDA